ncbi:EamA family transporter [Streptomyces sp. ms191]|uniref:EamA family transporter n=1 Tax=Streptomyces sp. ms191 TaxID=1827978 RepID=UPI0011CD7587|nr:EamA family transporter [Streptomyces sp. ms191]TXS29806.1 EamA family transporter [Streptomyces sp. ms191]
MRPAHIALAALVAAVWGVNFVVVEIGLGHFPPLLFSALRFLVAALPAVFLVGRPKAAWKWIVGVGLVLGVAKFGLLFTGMDLGAPAGLSSLVLQIQAVFTALFAFVALGERPGRTKLVGMAVALAGIGVAAVDEDASGPLAGFAFCVAAAACWGVSNVLTRKAAPPDALNFMVWVSTVPVLPLLALSLVLEGPERDLAALRGLDWAGAGVVLYVAWVTTIFGFGAWGWLLRRHPASSVAPFSLLVPVFGMSSAALFLGEGVSPLRWCAAALLVGGVALTSLAPAEAAPAPSATAPAMPPPVVAAAAAGAGQLPSGAAAREPAGAPEGADQDPDIVLWHGTRADRP